jgi:hypothetical protein
MVIGIGLVNDALARALVAGGFGTALGSTKAQPRDRV